MDCGNFKKLENVMLSVEEEEISFMCSFLSGFAVMAIFSSSIESLMDKIPIGQMKAPLVIIIAARTNREFEYKQKVMDFLLKKYKLKNTIGRIYTPNPIFFAEALR